MEMHGPLPVWQHIDQRQNAHSPNGEVTPWTRCLTMSIHYLVGSCLYMC